MLTICIALIVVMDDRYSFGASMVSPRMVLLYVLGSVLLVVLSFVISLIAPVVNLMHTLWRFWW